MKVSQQNIKDSLFPLYLGITGHRDVRDEDKDRLKEIIKEFVKARKIQCPNTPIVLITPLAEGADRIAAQAAIECDIEFIAALPMPVSSYKRSFVSSESVLEFDSLLVKASKTIVLGLPEGVSLSEVFENPEQRHEQYYQLGVFIAKYCHTLIALWDGKDGDKKGGTASVIRSKRAGIPGRIGKTCERLQFLQTGPVYHILTPRKDQPVPDIPFTTKDYYSSYLDDDEANAEKQNRKMLEHIDSLNRDISDLSESMMGKARKSSERLFGSDLRLKLDPALLTIAKRRGIIRELAILFQSKRILALKVLLILVVLAFCFLQIYSVFYRPLYLFLYPLIMGIGALWFYLAKKKRFEYKHEDYRALAEAFRIQFYLKAIGSKDNVSDHYLKRHRGELEWVLYALRSSELEAMFEHSTKQSKWENEPIKGYSFLRKNWIDEQLNYYRKNAIRNNLLQRKWLSLSNSFFLGAIVLACILLIGIFAAGKSTENAAMIKQTLNSVLGILTQVSLVFAAVTAGYSEKMVYSEQAKSYQQMMQLFNIAKIKLSAAIETNNRIEAEEIILELAHDALIENGDWLLLHRSRPLEIPRG